MKVPYISAMNTEPKYSPEITYASGLRVSELLALPLTALARDPAFLMVKGKGGKERLAPLTTPRVAPRQSHQCQPDRPGLRLRTNRGHAGKDRIGAIDQPRRQRDEAEIRQCAQVGARYLE
eukprot:gene59865-81899_t